MKRLHILTTGLALAALAADASSGSGAAAAAAAPDTAPAGGPADAAVTTDTVRETVTAAAAAAAAPSTSTTANPADKAAPHPDDAKKAAKAKKTTDANVEAADANGDGKLKYRVLHDFHDTTTGRVRKKGRAVLADAERAAVLIAAKVVDPKPLAEDDPDQTEDDDGQNADAGVNVNAIAPATVGGVVDQAVIVENGAGAAVTDGNRDGTLPKALSTADAPAIVTGKGGKAS